MLITLETVHFNKSPPNALAQMSMSVIDLTLDTPQVETSALNDGA